MSDWSFYVIVIGAILTLGAFLHARFVPPDETYDDPLGLVVPPFNGEGLEHLGAYLVGAGGIFLMILGGIGAVLT